MKEREAFSREFIAQAVIIGEVHNNICLTCEFPRPYDGWQAVVVMVPHDNKLPIRMIGSCNRCATGIVALMDNVIVATGDSA